MKLQRQPNRWSCVPVAISIATGIALDNLIEAIGHDGSQIIFPDLPEPMRRRGFHLQECSIALLKFNYSLIIFDKLVMWGPNEQYAQTETIDLQPYLKNYSGVIVGQFSKKPYAHAVAWDHIEQLIYDPKGETYPFDSRINVLTFCPLNQII